MTRVEKLQKLLDFGLLTDEELNRITRDFANSKEKPKVLAEIINILERSIANTKKEEASIKANTSKLIKEQKEVVALIEKLRNKRSETKVTLATKEWNEKRKNHNKIMTEMKLEHKRLLRVVSEIEKAIQKRLEAVAINNIRKKI